MFIELKNSFSKVLTCSLLFLCVLICVSLISCSSIKRASSPPIVEHYQISHVNVIDVLTEEVKENQTVEVKNGIIIRINSSDIDNEITDTKITNIDGRDKYLIPGLWDSHSTMHQLSPELDFPLYIANGITSIRSNVSCPSEAEVSLYACLKDKAQWKKMVLAGDMVGPTIQGSGTFPINGNEHLHPDSPSFHGAGTIIQAKNLVDHYANFPADEKPFFLKVYNWIPKTSYIELVNYANQKGFEISGHMPRQLGLIGAVDAGQRSFSHARLFMFDCSTQRSALQSGQHWDKPLPQLYQLLMDTFDQTDCQEKYQYLAKKDLYLTPTLLTRRNDYYAVASLEHKVAGMDYIHYLFTWEWLEDIGKLGEELSESEQETFKLFYEFGAKTIADAQKNGVSIMAGTDSYDIYIVPGFSLHEELEALHNAGLSNINVLKSATITPARYFKMEDTIGSINEGKVADMVLLNKNPLVDIKNSKSINTVFKGELIYNQVKINTLKSNVKKLTRSHQVTVHLIGLLLQNPRGF